MPVHTCITVHEKMEETQDFVPTPGWKDAKSEVKRNKDNVKFKV